MRLALAFGRPDVDRFLAGLSARQYEEWGRYFEDEPFGWYAVLRGVAEVAAIMAAAHGGKGEAGDFIPRWETPRPASGTKRQGSAMRAVAAAAAAAAKET